MEKTMREEDIKGLEKEIDNAVDRLFIEKKRGAVESSLMDSSFLESYYAPEKKFDRESAPVSLSPSFLKSIEKMETQLLSLEWDITKENLEKTKEEILILRGVLGGNPNVSSVLNLMKEVLNHMIKKEEKIPPPLIKFLLDSKETIKLLMKKEMDGEISIYKQLAYSGIEARFSCLEGIKELKTKQPSLILSGEIDRGEMPMTGGEKIEEFLSRMNLFSEKVSEILKKFDLHLLAHERMGQKPLGKLVETKPTTVNVTIFRVDGRLFGIESDKIFKLFKVPSGFYNKFSTQQKIRFKDFEFRMINLKKIFSIPGENQKEEKQILTVKDNGEYKGLMIDQVLSKLTTSLDSRGEYGEYFFGMIHWTYQNHPVEIPILDLKKF